MFDCLIIGGGATGLSAAVFLPRFLPGGRFAVLERGVRVGRKLLATGNGTCNITNQHAGAARYHGADPAFVTAALDAFPPQVACDFFASIGVECRARADGRVYPLCEQAAAVLDCLRLEAAARGVREITGSEVTSLAIEDGGFRVTAGGDAYRARRVLVGTGGAAAPALGGGTGGYALLTALGHTRTPLFPSIVQWKTDTAYVRALKGVRIDARLALEQDGRLRAADTGELLFTEYGLSGPVAMQISRPVADWERRKQGTLTAVIDCLPTIEPARLRRLLAARTALPGRQLDEYLTGLTPKRLGQTLLRAAGFTLSRPAASLTEAEQDTLAAALKGWRIPVTGTQGMGGAQVTAGGIATAEFDPQTMASRRVPGLYAAGEVLDIDGDCGGYNLQWAWASAHAAATAIARSLADTARKDG